MGITPRQREILELYIDEGSLALVAERTGLAMSTIKNQLLNARRRTDSRHNVQLVYLLATGDLDDS